MTLELNFPQEVPGSFEPIVCLQGVLEQPCRSLTVLLGQATSGSLGPLEQWRFYTGIRLDPGSIASGEADGGGKSNLKGMKLN